MKILEKCFAYRELVRHLFHYFQNMDKNFFQELSLLDQRIEELSELRRTIRFLSEWDVLPELLVCAQVVKEEQLCNCAKELIAEVNRCILEKKELQYNNVSVRIVDLLIQQENNSADLFEFMEKYVKAASIMLREKEINYEDQIFLNSLVDTNQQSSDVLSKKLNIFENGLHEKRDSFIQAAVIWKEQDEEKSTVQYMMPVQEKLLLSSKEEYAGQEENILDESISKKASDTEECGNSELKDENLDKDSVFEEFYQIINGAPVDSQNKSEWKSGAEYVYQEISSDSVSQKEQIEVIPLPEEIMEKAVQLPDEISGELVQQLDEMTKETVPHLVGIPKETVQQPDEMIEEAAQYPVKILEETVQQPQKPFEEVIQQPDEMSEEPMLQSDLPVIETIPITGKTIEAGGSKKKEKYKLKKQTLIKKKRAESIDCSSKSFTEYCISAMIYEKYREVFQCWIEKVQNGELQELPHYDDMEKLCWELLNNGEYMLARELMITIEKLCQKDRTVVIDMVGSGLYLPVTELNICEYFLSFQPLMRWEKMQGYQRIAAVLSAIPAAHYNRKVKLNEIMIDVLPECYRKWVAAVVKQRKGINYLAYKEIENYRLYKVRLRKVQAILKREEKQFEVLHNTKIGFEAANKVLVTLCGRDMILGQLHEIMNKESLEIQAFGIYNSYIKKLYILAKKHIPEQKNSAKSTDERLLEGIIQSGMDKRGYTTEIIGQNRNKMEQFIREYLLVANDWLKLMEESCLYNPNDPSVQFIEKSADMYRLYRAQMHEYIKTINDERLAPVYRQVLYVMDYLIGEKDGNPKGWKSYNQHVYRLCAIPSVDIRKDETGHYCYMRQEPAERLRFLENVLQDDPVAVDECIYKFIEVDAFSGCEILFELLPQEKTKSIEEYYRQKVTERLEEITSRVDQMRKCIYQMSVFAGWLGKDYQSVNSQISQIGFMLRNPKDISQLCQIYGKCETEVERITKKFRGILREQVSRQHFVNMSEERKSELNAMLDEGQYSTVIEWMVYTDKNIDDVESEDFFNERYFNETVYSTKQRGLLDSKGQLFSTITEKLQNTVKKSHSWSCFNYNRVPGSLGADRARLIGIWYEIKVKLQSSKNGFITENDNIYNLLKDMLGLLGWKEVHLERCECHSDGGRNYIQFDMHFADSYSRDKCPIPLFGSKSDRRIRMLCLYGSTYAPDKLNHLVENDNEQIPIIILFFGVMTRKRRMELYSLALEKQSSFLVVDEIIMATVCERRESMLLRWLYMLAVPFSVQRMYSSSMGVVFPEMFYGRVSAKKELGISGAVCAVYGGRQLGKTALLKNIEYESHRSQDEHFVYYIKLPTVAMENLENVIVKIIAQNIKAIDGLDKACTDMETLLNSIEDWLQSERTRRLLLLLDEADQFLLADSKNGFHITGNINGRMTSTNLRFKVVFAGLHNVYRMMSLPNHPLAHHGKPISIGPLLEEELQDAINLIRQPFDIMGYRFENLDLIIRILAETNYYPSLIQLFCMKLHDHLRFLKGERHRCENLPVTIYMKDIDAVLEDQELKKSISDRFMWTLELDARYKAIALSIAFDAGSAVCADPLNNIVDGYDLQWISTEVKKWPDLFGELSSCDNIRGLCDELVQLGILSNVSNDRFTLRTANILNMLGTPESILIKLYELDNEKYNYNTMFNGTLFRERFRDEKLQYQCYPLSDQQIHSLLDNGGVKIILGSHALGLENIENCLQELFSPDIVNFSAYNHQKSFTLKVYRTELPKFKELVDEVTVSLVCAECSWDMETVRAYEKKLNTIQEEKRPILLFLCDEARNHQIQVEKEESIEIVPVIRLTTWNMEAVQFWLNEVVPVPLLSDDIARIMNRLRGWPKAMYQFREILAEPLDSENALDQTIEYLLKEEMLYNLLPDYRIEPVMSLILEIYSQYKDKLCCEEMQLLLKDEKVEIASEKLRRIMDWMADCRLLIKRSMALQEQKDMCAKDTYSMDSLLLELWEGRKMNGTAKR